MTSVLRPLLRSVRALLLGLTVLCLLAQPVLAAAHELHDVEHTLAGDSGSAADEETSSPPGTLERLLHAFDCCLHATAAPTSLLLWSPHRLQSLPPQVSLPAHTPATSSRFLRPPIAA